MEPLDYSNRPLGETNGVNLGSLIPQTQNITPVLSTNMNMSNNASKFQMNPMGHVYVQASSLMNSFMLQDGSHTYGSPSMSFAHLSHHFNSIRGHDQGLSPATQPNHNHFQYPMTQTPANSSQIVPNGSPVISNAVSNIGASSDSHGIAPGNLVARPVSESQVPTCAASTPYASTTINNSILNSSSANLPSYQERSTENVSNSNNNNNNTTSTSSSSGQWSDHSESNDTKLSAQQLRLQRETQDERERRLVAGRERMRLYRARERMLESPEERERRLAIARERTRLGRALENPDQRERRLKKTRERLRMKRQMESQEERERRLKQHRENKRERYHKMSPDERSMLRRAGGQRTRSVSSGSSQSDCDPSPASSQRGNARNTSLRGQWNNDMDSFPFGLEVKVEPDDVLGRVDPAPAPPVSTATDSIPAASSSVASAGVPAQRTGASSGVCNTSNQPSLRLPPDKATQSQAPVYAGHLHYPPLPPSIVAGSVAHPNFNYNFKPSSAGILQAIRPLRFGTPPQYPSSSSHLPPPNYNHRDLCNTLNPA